jgi:hypothetical protein
MLSARGIASCPMGRGGVRAVPAIRTPSYRYWILTIRKTVEHPAFASPERPC